MEPYTDPFPGFKHLGIAGLGHSGLDAEIRVGITRYRGRNHNWILHDLGPYGQNFSRVESGDIHCDAIIANVYTDEQAKRLRALKLPVFSVVSEVGDSRWRTHGLDLKRLGEMAAAHFREEGHRHFCFYSMLSGEVEREIWDGFRSALEKSSETLCWYRRGDERIDQVRPHRETVEAPATIQWFKTMPRPMAVFTRSDQVAEKVAELAFFSKVSVPEEMALLGAGNLRTVCENCYPNLSSIVLPGEQLGYEVAAHVDAVFQGKREVKLKRFPPLKVVVRHSSGGMAVDDLVVARALSIMRLQAASRITVKEIVDPLSISMRSFTERFKAAMGRTPKEELVRIRLDRVRERLLETDQTVEHISSDCGFPDAEAMARAFKRATGLTPTQFRKQNAS